MSANPHRGEVTLTLSGATYRLRPTFEALVATEEKIGSLMGLVERAGSGQIRLKDIVCLLHSCALAGGHDVDAEAFAAQVMQTGIAATTEPLRQILSGFMTGQSGTED